MRPPLAFFEIATKVYVSWVEPLSPKCSVNLLYLGKALKL